jgi:hypothetical protein
MARFVLAWVVLIGFLAVTEAAPRQKRTPANPPVPVKRIAAEPEEEYVITARTEIILDGKECKFDDVPDDAEIILMEVAANRKTILKIHFESKEETERQKQAAPKE